MNLTKGYKWQLLSVILQASLKQTLTGLQILENVYHWSKNEELLIFLWLTLVDIFTSNTAQKKKFSIKDFLSKCDQICRNLRISSHLLKKSLLESFIFCAVKEKQEVNAYSNNHFPKFNYGI